MGLEKDRIDCHDAIARWEALVTRARTLSESQRNEFVEIAGEIGLAERMSVLRQACADPEGAPAVLGEPIAAALERAAGQIFILEEGVETASRLGVSVRSAVIAAGETALSALSRAEQERLRAVRASTLPVVLGIAGGIFTTVLGAILR